MESKLKEAPESTMAPEPAVQMGTPPAYVMAARKELEEAEGEGIKEKKKVELSEGHDWAVDEAEIEEPKEIVEEEAIEKKVEREMKKNRERLILVFVVDDVFRWI